MVVCLILSFKSQFIGILKLILYGVWEKKRGDYKPVLIIQLCVYLFKVCVKFREGNCLRFGFILYSSLR